MSDLDRTGQEIVTELVMLRSVDSRLALVVEGPEDHSLLNARADPDALSLTVAHGKRACVDAALVAEAEELAWLRVLIDRDFDVLPGDASPWPSTVVASEGYDLQADYMSAEKSMIARVILAHLDPDQTSLFRERFPDGVAEHIVRCAALVATLRLAVVTHSLNISTRGWSLHGLCEADERGQAIAWFAKLMHQRSKGRIGTADIEKVFAEGVKGADAWDIVCGHDLVELVRQVIARFSGKAPRRDTVERELRQAVSDEVFAGLPAIRMLSAWGEAHSARLWSSAA